MPLLWPRTLLNLGDLVCTAPSVISQLSRACVDAMRRSARARCNTVLNILNARTIVLVEPLEYAIWRGR
jgi:hypothetical protein